MNDVMLIVKRLDLIVEKLDVLINQRKERARTEEVMDLLELPDHLRKSLIALIKLGSRGTAEEVAVITGRARAVESGYLNQLILMKWVTKDRDGRKVVFTKVKRGA